MKLKRGILCHSHQRVFSVKHRSDQCNKDAKICKDEDMCKDDQTGLVIRAKSILLNFNYIKSPK